MKKNVRKIILRIVLFGFIAGVLTAGGLYYYAFIYMESHRTTPADLDPDIIISAEQLLKDVNSDWEKAGKTGKIPAYLDEDGAKIIQVSGPVASIHAESSGNVTINLLGETVGINCNIDSMLAEQSKTIINKYTEGDVITIKGKCTGFDYDEEAFELLGEENKFVKLSECIIIEDGARQ